MAETDKTQEVLREAPKKNYSLSILLFLLGIVAVAALAVYTTLRGLPKVFLISEMVALLSLIGLLIVSINSKRRMVRQYALNERYPYAGVEKKEIEAIFDKIAEEEGKRRKLDAFASGVDLSKMPTVTAAAPKEQPAEQKDESAGGKDAEESTEENDMIPVFPDDEEESSGSGEKAPADDGEEKKPAAKKPAHEHSDEAPKQRKKRPAEEGRHREGSSREGQRQRRPRPYDPYYEEYYYDSHGKRHRAPTYYDEYGNPIRPRVVYDEYGNPIRRRPADPYRSQSGKKRRPAEGGKRPASGGQRSGAQRKRQSSGPVAPVEMTPIKQRSNYGDDYVPVAIVDEEDTAPVPASRPAGKKRRPPNAKEAAERKPYVPHYDEDEVIVTIPDYDEDEDLGDDYVSPAAAAKAKARAAAEGASSDGGSRKRPVQERYVPDYSEDEGVVFIPDYEDEEDTAPAPARAPGASSSAQRQRNAPAYDDYEEEEDEGVIVLPHDEGYEEYVENKRAEERKAARRASGKTALAIVKLRHKKIRRKSRKYKTFRASRRSLSDYLNSYSVRTRR